MSAEQFSREFQSIIGSKSVDGFERIEVVKEQWREALAFKLLQFVGVVATYLLMVGLGTLFDIMGNGGEFLFSLVFLPLVVILKDCGQIIDVHFVEIALSDSFVYVKSGWLVRSVDKLELKNVENIETLSTPYGRMKGYGGIDLYSYGGNIRIPYVANHEDVLRRLERNIDAAKTRDGMA